MKLGYAFSFAILAWKESNASLVNTIFGFSTPKLCKKVCLPTFPQKCLMICNNKHIPKCGLV